MKRYAILFFVLIGLVASHATHGQSMRKEKRKEKRREKADTNYQQQQPTTLEPYYPKKEYAPKRSKSKEPFVIYNAEKRYYEQLRRMAKSRRKAEKEMLKPQYSDPSYFGHKRKPKKHKPGKMKYCRECGLRH